MGLTTWKGELVRKTDDIFEKRRREFLEAEGSRVQIKALEDLANADPE